MKCTKLCIKQVLLKSFILINNINDITKWQMNNFFKINYDLYDQWLIVIDHRLLTILNIINFSLKTTKRGFTFFFGIFRIRWIYIVKVIAIAPRASWVGLNMQKRQLGYESSLTYLRKIRFINTTVHEALELDIHGPLRGCSGLRAGPIFGHLLMMY